MNRPSLADVANAVSTLEISRKRLGDASVPVAVAEYSVDASPELAIGGKKAQLAAGFEAAVEEFNSLDDVDSAAILRVPKKGEEAAPPLILTTETAWLKYRIGGSLRLQGGGEISSVGFSFDADARLELLDYRLHRRSEILAEAVVHDLSRPRVIFSLESVGSLVEGEALALKARGALRLGVTVSWADVVTSGLTTLTSALKAAAPISISLDTGLRTSVEVSLQGDFALLYARDRAGLRITVSKATSVGLGLSAKAGVGVEFTNLDKAVMGVLESLLGAKYEVVVSALQKANPKNLKPAEQALFDDTVTRLGLTDTIRTVQGLLDRIVGLKAEVAAKLVAIATSRVEIGLSYEYSRTGTNEALIDAYVRSDAAFQAVHPDLVRGDVRSLIAGVGDEGNFELNSFLRRSTLETKSSWGFSFSVGKLLSAKGVDSESLRTVKEQDEKGRTRMTLEAIRGYEAGFSGRNFSWKVNFLATMKEFVATPNASDFDYGLHLAYIPKGRPKPADLEFLSDLAALWGAGSYEPASQAALAAALTDQAGGFTVAQAIPEIALAEIAERAAADTNRSVLASAMAAALPYRKDWPERRSVGLRRALYGPILHALISGDGFRAKAPSEVRGWIGSELRKRGTSNAGLEGTDNVPGSLFDVLRLQGYFERANGFMDHVKSFERGIRSLAAVLGSEAAGVAPNEIEYAYEQMKPFFCQSFFIRTVAHYFFLFAHQARVDDLVQRAATLEYGNGAKVLMQ